MKLVLTLLVRNEADIVDANIAYHLSRGVDFVVAMDNNSDDGTLDILEEHARRGYLQVIRQPDEGYAQSEWVSEMARIAATEHDADWIIHGDADEFWWPRAGTLKDIFASIPERYGVFQGHRFDFVPRPDEEGFFAERMTARVRLPDKVKVAHRPEDGVVVGQGSHRLAETELAAAPPWYAVDVLHFPLRGYAQFEQKIVTAGAATGVKHWRNAHELLARDELRQAWEALLLDEAAVDEIAAGRRPLPPDVLVGRSSKRPAGGLTRDLRLRDYLRALRAGNDETAVSPAGFSLARPAADDPVPDPEIDVLMEIMERNLDEAIKSYVVEAKEHLRQTKARLVALKDENAHLRQKVGRLRSR